MRTASVVALALAIAGAAPLWAPNCTKGKPCGNSCIPMSSTCHIGAGGSSERSVYEIPSAPASAPRPGGAPAGPCATSSEDLNLAVQTLLRALGYQKTPASTHVDGAVTAALIRYQRVRRLPLKDDPDGAVLVALALDAAQRLEGKQ